MKENVEKYYLEEDKRPNDFTFRCIRVIIPVVGIALILYVIFSIVNHYSSTINISVPSVALTVKGLIGSLTILCVSYFIGRIVDHRDVRLKYIFLFLIIVMTTLVQTYMSYIMTLVTFAPLLLAAQYSDKGILKFAYALSMISSCFVVIMSYEIGLCDANMVILPTETLRYYGQNISGEIKPLSEVYLSLISLGILPRLILITAFTPLINSIVDNRKEMVVNEYQSRYQGEHDGFTGFYNRTKYNSLLETDFLSYKNVSLIFFDINNLKYINDSKGHSAGDKLILMASDSIDRASTKDMYAFRFGGDEFLVVIPEGTKKDAEDFIERWKVIVDVINMGSEDIKCEMAYGLAADQGPKFHECLKAADESMYKNKQLSKLAR